MFLAARIVGEESDTNNPLSEISCAFPQFAVASPRLSSDKEQKPLQLKLVFLYPWRDLSLRPSLLPPYPGPVFLPLAPFLRQNCLFISSLGAPPRLFSTSPNRRAHLQSLWPMGSRWFRMNWRIKRPSHVLNLRPGSYWPLQVLERCNFEFHD